MIWSYRLLILASCLLMVASSDRFKRRGVGGIGVGGIGVGGIGVGGIGVGGIGVGGIGGGGIGGGGGGSVVGGDGGGGGGSGGGGGGGGVGGGTGGSGSSSGSGSTSGSTIGIIIGSILGGLFLFICCIFCFTTCLGGTLCSLCKSRSNDRYVRGGTPMQYDVSRAVFKSGTYASSYYQYGGYKGPDKMKLGFFPEADFRVHGGGTDKVGTYVISGVYSPDTLRMGLTKQYQLGTGDPSENLGHSVKIQVEWKHESQQFEGKYYVRQGHPDENIFFIRHQDSRY